MNYISAIYNLAVARSNAKPLSFGRGRRGGPTKTITDEQVLEIRRRCKPVPRGGRNGVTALAEEYGVAISTISNIVNYQTRSHPFNPLDPENT